MTSAFWYGLLCLLSSGVFGYTLYKRRNQKVFALYLFVAGITYLFEYIVLVLCNAYVYLPKILTDSYFDNILGAVISDAFTIPMSASFVGAFQLNWLWTSVITIIIVGIEELFLKLHIYQHYWWKTSYTGLGVLLAFFMSKKLAIKLKNAPTRFVRGLTLYLTSLFVQANLVFILVAFFHSYFYKIGWFENPTRDHVSFSTAFILLLGLIMVFIVVSKISWIWKITLLLATSFFDIVLYQLNILHLSANWSIGYFLILRLIIIGMLMLTNRFVLK